MANEEHVTLIQQGVADWNQWRADSRNVVPDLVGASLRGLDLTGANLGETDLKGADVRGTILSHACLIGADLTAANMFKAVLDNADLNGAELRGARFLDCAQLTAARNWQAAFRDESLACGAPIPEPGDRDKP
jgi:uncharacterized protein YjbI with pentapeptide repeats